MRRPAPPHQRDRFNSGIASHRPQAPPSASPWPATLEVSPHSPPRPNPPCFLCRLIIGSNAQGSTAASAAATPHSRCCRWGRGASGVAGRRHLAAPPQLPACIAARPPACRVSSPQQWASLPNPSPCFRAVCRRHAVRSHGGKLQHRGAALQPTHRRPAGCVALQMLPLRCCSVCRRVWLVGAAAGSPTGHPAALLPSAPPHTSHPSLFCRAHSPCRT